jgi:molybdate transport system permease protein
MALLASILFAFLLLPLIALALRALSEGLPSLTNLLDPSIGRAILVSLLTSATSLAVIVLLGTPVAFVFARFRFPLKRLLTMVIQFPIVMPPVVAGLALLIAFGRRGLFSWWLEGTGIIISFTPVAVVLAQVFVSAPYYIRAAQMRFQSIPRELEEAASIDGASGWQALRHIILPLSWRGLLIGMLLSWARALGEFGATILFAGSLQGRTQTMPLLVYAALERDIEAAIWTGLLLIIIAGLSMGGVQWLLPQADGESEDPLIITSSRETKSAHQGGA